jgi:hypothetical protein
VVLVRNGSILTTHFVTDKHRPVNDDGERVAPSDLLEYRRLHNFQGPTCLCVTENSGNEAAIFISTEDESLGEYVAACASGNCGYWGESY